MIDRRQSLKWVASGMALASAIVTRPLAAKIVGAPLYKKAAAPIAERVRDLLGRMTIEEKVVQLTAIWARKSEVMDGLTFNPAKATLAFPDGIGQITRASDKRGVAGVAGAAGGTAARWRTPGQTVAFVNAVQRWALEKTRLGIPVLFHEESLHGYMATEATMFPQAIALAGSFDRDLMRDVSAVIAREVRARGVVLVLSPVVDIARDPRWGRIEETFGEDPYLCGEMGLAAVEGLQGRGKFERLGPDKVFATLKHMTGHGQAESGNNVSPAQISERELRANFFPPFRKVVERTSIGAVMPSYNEIDGVPSHGSRWLLGDVLRREWGFDGLIVSDYGAIRELQTIHHVAENIAEAARLALMAGVDVELPDSDAYQTLIDQVKSGRVDIAVLDIAVERMLTLKFRSGAFEDPFADAARAQKLTGNAEARALALKAARKSICLLTNDGTLPLPAPGKQTIALIGPNHAIARLGGYSSVPKQAISLLDGLAARIGTAAKVLTAQGVFITQSEDRSVDEVILGDPERNRNLIAEAVAVAQQSDVIILAIGDTEQTSREGFAKNHLGDRTSLDLLAQQSDLFDALHATGKPIVVCAINGRPPSWPTVAAKANAVLECWYPGQEGGTAIAEALFGDINPGAKLPISVVRDAGQVPLFYNRKPSSRRGYLFAEPTPLFPFGHGLSYTSFKIEKPQLSKAKIGSDDEVGVSVTIQNIGDREGDEVVQIYVRDQSSSTARPILELKDFARVTLRPGESRIVRFTLGREAFAMWNAATKEVVEPGLFDILAGPNSVELQSATLEIA